MNSVRKSRGYTFEQWLAHLQDLYKALPQLAPGDFSTLNDGLASTYWSHYANNDSPQEAFTAVRTVPETVESRLRLIRDKFEGLNDSGLSRADVSQLFAHIDLLEQFLDLGDSKKIFGDSGWRGILGIAPKR